MRIKMFIDVDVQDKGVRVDADVIGLPDSLHCQEMVSKIHRDSARFEVDRALVVNNVARIAEKAYEELTHRKTKGDN